MNLVNSLIRYLPASPMEIETQGQKGVSESEMREKYQTYLAEQEKAPLILPTKIKLDASTICQLRCRTCSFQRNNCHSLGRGYLTFENFKAFVDKHDYIKEIELANYGEIFLNPELLQIVKYAYEKNVALTAGSGVNFNTVSEEMIEALVKYQFKHIMFSIDGASQETYSIYRINGVFDTVIRNIQRLSDYKQKYNSQFPDLKWQYILMEHNENDVIKAKKMANELGMSIYFKLTWDPGYTPKNIEMLRQETGLAYFSREETLVTTGKPYANYSCCRNMWKVPQINWDGRLLGCCVTTKSDYGVNVFDIGLEKALDSMYFWYAKEMLQGKAGIPENTKHIPCANCRQYQAMRKTGQYIVLS